MDVADEMARAAARGDTGLVALLLGEGAVVDAPDSHGRTALDLAAYRGHAEVARLLVEAGADLQQPAGEYGELTPLCLAAMHGHTAVAAVLLDAGAHTGAQGRMRYVPLVLAATAGDRGHPRTVDLLLDRRADIHGVMKDKTPVEWAAAFGLEPIVRHLLHRGATPTSKAIAVARRCAERRPGSRQQYERIIEALRTAQAHAGAPSLGTGRSERGDRV